MDMVRIGTVSLCLIAQRALVYFDLDVGTASVSVTSDVELRADSAGTAAKTQQERPVFDFVTKNQAAISFDAVSILPAYCFGPPTNEQADIEEIGSGAVATMYKVFNWPQDKELSVELAGADVMIDVRDVAELMVRSLFTEKAGGERFLTNSHRFTWQQVEDALNIEPKLPGAPLTVGELGTGNDVEWNPEFSSQNSRDVFGFEYRTFEETMRDA
ncbi:hypothetical protein FRC04_004417 [Tulasnella sp. 424]|nr:hypothetical protein FRC04_004417 [Tulasnella sp. 424]KAG8979528.1 hypothetical protein FRC05_008517 [Tulasnella sp. 425]